MIIIISKRPLSVVLCCLTNIPKSKVYYHGCLEKEKKTDKIVIFFFIAENLKINEKILIVKIVADSFYVNSLTY